ncbi:unnamed protein product [Linum tenue]|uniref:Uncharacterized protein n=1 Tax=Linum tenue TaxID=586396 RepID=A0AAV0HGB2_9ROSI|nr:unnamed protein product [Linum tenue]
MRRVQIPEEKMCPRLHLGSLFPSKQSSQIRFRPQSFRGQQCYQDVTGNTAYFPTTSFLFVTVK